MAITNPKIANRFIALDGWRGISILLVLATHLLPLGPKAWQLNFASGLLGMSLFFTLSGFLITNFLLHHPSVVDFLIRRFFRIVPLAWLYLVIALSIAKVPRESWIAHFFFYANWPPMKLVEITSHFWSLCVEVQFYVGIAILFAVLRRRGLMLIPFLCLVFTLYRIVNDVHVAINTYYRIDEILVGGILSLIYNNKLGSWPSTFLGWVNPYIVIALLLVSCHPDSEFMNYFRPYFAATLVGSTLYNNETRIAKLLGISILFYIAEISYALYIIHPMLADSWLGSGTKLIEYAKRPLLFAVLFLFAHTSTFYFEHKMVAMGKKLSSWYKPKVLPN